MKSTIYGCLGQWFEPSSGGRTKDAVGIMRKPGESRVHGYMVSAIRSGSESFVVDAMVRTATISVMSSLRMTPVLSVLLLASRAKRRQLDTNECTSCSRGK